MKFFAVLCALLVASVSGNTLQYDSTEPELTLKQQRFVVDLILSLIEDTLQSLRDAGYDPLHIERETYNWALPVPSILSATATVEEVHFTGLTNLIIHRMNFATLATRLTFDVELPRLDASVRKANGEVSFVGVTIDGEGSGSVVVRGIRVVGDVRLNVGIISGISVRSLSLDFTLQAIEPNVNLVIYGTDISDHMNEFLGVKVPTTVREYREDINALLEHYAVDIINDILADI